MTDKTTLQLQGNSTSSKACTSKTVLQQRFAREIAVTSQVSFQAMTSQAHGQREYGKMTQTIAMSTPPGSMRIKVVVNWARLPPRVSDSIAKEVALLLQNGPL